MYCLKKAFPDIENLPNKLSAQRTKLRTTKCTYQRAKAIIETFPPQDQEYYYQLCFLKDRLWQVQIPEEDLLSDKLLDQLKKALELAMPMIRFLEEGIGY